eukprot:COSAG02_NODE_51_length_44689_cov_29.477361_25_plen_176_part_00
MVGRTHNDLAHVLLLWIDALPQRCVVGVNFLLAGCFPVCMHGPPRCVGTCELPFRASSLAAVRPSLRPGPRRQLPHTSVHALSRLRSVPRGPGGGGAGRPCDRCMRAHVHSRAAELWADVPAGPRASLRRRGLDRIYSNICYLLAPRAAAGASMHLYGRAVASQCTCAGSGTSPP